MLNLRHQYRKWKFERKHGKHSYGAVLFLSGLKRMIDEDKAERPVLDEEPSPKLKWDDGWDDDEPGIEC